MLLQLLEMLLLQHQLCSCCCCCSCYQMFNPFSFKQFFIIYICITQHSFSRRKITLLQSLRCFLFQLETWNFLFHFAPLVSLDRVLFPDDKYHQLLKIIASVKMAEACTEKPYFKAHLNFCSSLFTRLGSKKVHMSPKQVNGPNLLFAD